MIKNKFNIIDEFIYPDHYKYNENDISKIKKRANKLGAQIITTEKDYVKISQLDRENIDFLEITLIIENEKELKNFIEEKISWIILNISFNTSLLFFYSQFLNY